MIKEKIGMETIPFNLRQRNTGQAWNKNDLAVGDRSKESIKPLEEQLAVNLHERTGEEDGRASGHSGAFPRLELLGTGTRNEAFPLINSLSDKQEN
jgi:hypothetical protein